MPFRNTYIGQHLEQFIGHVAVDGNQSDQRAVSISGGADMATSLTAPLQRRFQIGKLVGLTNWRLAGLQKAIADDKCPTLRKVMSLSEAGFRNRDSGIHYAVARYFMLYLQEKGLLEEFYRTFRDSFDKDKTGITVAEKLLGEKLEDFEPKWREWVKGLSFP